MQGEPASVSAMSEHDDSDDVSRVRLPNFDELDRDLEELFHTISYEVRERIDARAAPAGASGGLMPNYGTELIQELERRREGGDIDKGQFLYCLDAANEILRMEMIYFEREFEMSREEPD